MISSSFPSVRGDTKLWPSIQTVMSLQALVQNYFVLLFNLGNSKLVSLSAFNQCYWSNKLERLSLAKPFKPCLIFAGKAEGCKMEY